MATGYHYEKVLCVTVIYADKLHLTGKETKWAVIIGADFPDAAKLFVGIQNVQVRKKRVYNKETGRV